MYKALAIGATGMKAHQQNVDTIADNIANANTPAFKKGRVGFVDLMMREGLREGMRIASSRGAALAAGVGIGIGSIAKVFDAGDMKQTGASFDVAIDGQGFLTVALEDGTPAYTRGGSLKVNKDGLLCAPSGQPLRPAIRIPDNVKSVVIGRDGRVTATMANASSPVELGQLELVRFANPPGLEANGEGLYRATEASGEAQAARPGEEGSGAIVQGWVEGSNVVMVDEMVNLMLAQRAYQGSLKVVQSADEMLRMVNELRK
jgi:flagellar basal-body rod protein FlgG